MEEETKNEIVKKVLEELKNKKLLKNPKSSYKSTEKILYSLNVLPEAIKLIDEEVKKLEEIAIPTAKSNSLILNERNNTYVYGDETLETRISELKQISVKAKSQIRLVKSALKKIENDKYYDIIPMYYFEEKTFDKIALEEGCTYQCVQRSVYRAVEKIKNILKNL